MKKNKISASKYKERQEASILQMAMEEQRKKEEKVKSEDRQSYSSSKELIGNEIILENVEEVQYEKKQRKFKRENNALNPKNTT